MKRRRIEKDMPAGKLERVEDFLPPPAELVMPEETVMVTLRLSEKSVFFFKQQAKKYHTKYQKMLRSLLDKYADKYAGGATP